MKPEKGKESGICNRTACDNNNAVFYNHSTRMWYCPECAKMINQYNQIDAVRFFGHQLCTLTDNTELEKEKYQQHLNQKKNG